MEIHKTTGVQSSATVRESKSKTQPQAQQQLKYQNRERTIQQTQEQTKNQAQKTTSKEEIKQTLDGLNEMFQVSHTHSRFILHGETDQYYVQIINDESNEVIKEIPSEKFMDMIAKMEKYLGLLIDEKV